jgi:hypothetical protein
MRRASIVTAGAIGFACLGETGNDRPHPVREFADGFQ